MSQGPGRAQRAIEAAFTARPSHRFTLTELCGVVYPDAEAVTPTQRKTVAKAAAKVAARMGWEQWRTGSNRARRAEAKQQTSYVRPDVALAASIAGRASLGLRSNHP